MPRRGAPPRSAANAPCETKRPATNARKAERFRVMTTSRCWTALGGSRLELRKQGRRRRGVSPPPLRDCALSNAPSRTQPTPHRAPSAQNLGTTPGSRGNALDRRDEGGQCRRQWGHSVARKRSEELEILGKKVELSSSGARGISAEHRCRQLGSRPGIAAMCAPLRKPGAARDAASVPHPRRLHRHALCRQPTGRRA